MTEQSAETIQRVVERLGERRLALPALLFLDAHKPLRFLAGQALAVAAPVIGLLGVDGVEDWSIVLNDADAFAQLQESLDIAAR
jgi:hypothetical protein